MSAFSKNSPQVTPVTLVLEIRGKKPVLERVTFQEQGKAPVSLEPYKKSTPKAIATVLTLFRTCYDCASFRISFKKKGKSLVKTIVSAVREPKNNPEAKAGNKGGIYSFADGEFLKLFLEPPDSADFSYVDLDLKRVKPSAVTIIKDNQKIEDVTALKHLAQQLAMSGGWELQKDYDLEAPSLQSSTGETQRPHSPKNDTIQKKIDAEKLTIADQQPSENELNDVNAFDVPQFVDLANRASRKAELKDLLSAHPIVSVAGLSGSGKSFLVASFLNSHPRFRNKGSVIWHDPDLSKDEPLETLVAKLDQPMKLSGKSLLAKCKQLMRQLETNNQLLVVDDFHSVDKGSYSVLIEAAARLKAPARLVLISQTNVGMTGDIPDLPHLEVVGFDHEELKRFLIQKKLGYLDDNLIVELLTKTEGLPIAAGWFAHMINGLKRSPKELLSGTMMASDRIRDWFNVVIASVGEPASKTLHMLSLCEGPFNLGVVRMLCRQGGNESFENLFETLQRAYLVQKYSKFRWRLHCLIVEFCRRATSEDFKKRIHLSLGIYHRDNALGIARRFSEEKALLWQVRSCQHLQKAGDFKRWNQVVHRIIPTLKSRGCYRLIIQLLCDEIKKNSLRDHWLTYNYAQCFLIIGRHEQSLKLIKPLVDRPRRDDPSLNISAVRLYADLLDATGKTNFALDKLQGVLDSDDAKMAHSRVVAQVKAVMVRLLTKLEKYDRAERLSEELLNESNDNIGRAVALTGWGVVLNCTGRFKQADDKLGQAVNLFAGKDNRGYGWSLSHHAICQLKLGNVDGASLMLREALTVKSEVEEASEEYVAFLRKAQPLFREGLLANIIEAEIKRASSQISILGR